jgi:hypothetical protein
MALTSVFQRLQNYTIFSLKKIGVQEVINDLLD